MLEHLAVQIPVINDIQQLCDNTFLSNIFSVQSDCPHRERFGYGGDLVATCDAFMMNYDMELFYSKAVRDWADAALPNGMLTDTAPYVGIQYCGIAWAIAHPLVQSRLYQYYGDRRLIQEQYPVSARWLDLVQKQYPAGIITDGLSDHESIAPVDGPSLLTPLYASAARMLGRLENISESDNSNRSRRPAQSSAATKYLILSEAIVKAYQNRFVTPSGVVGNNSQASLAFALEHNALPASMTAAVTDTLAKQTNQITTGILGTAYMLDTLSTSGYGASVYSMVRGDAAVGSSPKSHVGWKYMLDNGATTLWEHWEGSDNTYSLNHPMFGSVSQWICQWIGGIAPRIMPMDAIKSKFIR